VVTVPLYEQGLVYSQVRQAKQRASQSRITVIDATRQVRQAVAAAWAGLISARQAAASNATSVSASQLAFQGMQQEYQVGSRSTIDVLTAEQTLLDAQIAQVSAQHDALLASYQLQAAIGHLTGDHLGLFPVYDVKENYNKVRDKWIGTDADVLQ
jgi:outer membrane protein